MCACEVTRKESQLALPHWLSEAQELPSSCRTKEKQRNKHFQCKAYKRDGSPRAEDVKKVGWREQPDGRLGETWL